MRQIPVQVSDGMGLVDDLERSRVGFEFFDIDRMLMHEPATFGSNRERLDKDFERLYRRCLKDDVLAEADDPEHVITEQIKGVIDPRLYRIDTRLRRRPGLNMGADTDGQLIVPPQCKDRVVIAVFVEGAGTGKTTATFQYSRKPDPVRVAHDFTQRTLAVLDRVVFQQAEISLMRV